MNELSLIGGSNSYIIKRDNHVFKLPPQPTNEWLHQQVNNESRTLEHNNEIQILQHINDKQLLSKQLNNNNNTSRLTKRSDYYHQNIVRFLGINHQNNSIQLEYYEKGSLADALESNDTMLRDESIILKILLGVANGMMYLHSIDVIHRDVKPSNILLDNDYNPRICDFGTSKIITLKEANTTYSGTPGFMAPEIYNGLTYSLEADVYSFGVMMFTIISRILIDPRDDIDASIPLTWVQEYGEIIKRCVQPSPDKRPSFKDIIVMLQEMPSIADMLANPGPITMKSRSSRLRSVCRTIVPHALAEEKQQVFDDLNNLLKDTSRLVIKGWSGTGKTVLSNSFALYLESSKSIIPVWIDSSTLSNIISTYKYISQSLSININNNNNEDIINLIRLVHSTIHKIYPNQLHLFVFDNFLNDQEAMHIVLSSLPPNIIVLINTRYALECGSNVAQYNLSTQLSRDEVYRISKYVQQPISCPSNLYLTCYTIGLLLMGNKLEDVQQKLYLNLFSSLNEQEIKLLEVCSLLDGGFIEYSTLEGLDILDKNELATTMMSIESKWLVIMTDQDDGRVGMTIAPNLQHLLLSHLQLDPPRFTQLCQSIATHLTSKYNSNQSQHNNHIRYFSNLISIFKINI